MLSKEGYQILDVKHMFEKSVENHGNRAAFWVRKDDEKTHSAITYNEAYSDARGLGTSLIARGMKDRRIAIVGNDSYEWAVSCLAALCGTGVAVPLDKDLSINELKHFLSATQCSCAIFSGDLENVFWQIRNDGVTGLDLLINMDLDRHRNEWNILSLWELIDEGMQMVASGNHDFASAQYRGEELCAILFTAGTTSAPKGVNLSHGNIAAEISMASAALQVSEKDVFFSRLPSHCVRECICGTLLPLCRGASVVYGEGMKYDFDISAVQAYSLTESASIAALSADNGPAVRLLPEMKAKIVCPDPETGIGEIYLAGENIMMGYCSDPERTVEVLKDGWLHTGDLGKLDEKGCLYIAGRKENAILAENAKSVYPEELENCLNSIPYVLDSLVWGSNPGDSKDSGDNKNSGDAKDSDDGKAPVMTATIFADAKNVTEKLGAGYPKHELEKLLRGEIDRLNEQLPSFQRIEKIVLRREAFQKNSCQKIIRWYPANRES